MTMQCVQRCVTWSLTYDYAVCSALHDAVSDVGLLYDYAVCRALRDAVPDVRFAL